ncbi:uncharacterized protein [Ptychodera flava]|uniref:uncharacterized protein n=1 Tax=Ptychodera flava TaxID=63121 RepID=UPI00396A1F8E
MIRKERLDRASSAAKSRQSTVKKEEIKEEEVDSEWEDSRMKLILELSNQVSQQDEKVMQLDEKLSLKEQTIQELQKLQPRPPSGTRKGSALKLLKDIRLAADLSQPGSGDMNLNRGGMSSGVSKHSVISREGVSVDLRPWRF